MKNNKIIASWDKMKPDDHADKRMLNVILEQNRLVCRRKEEKYMAKTFNNWKILIPAAACLIVFMAAGIIGSRLSWFGSKEYTVELGNGDSVRFHRGKTGAASFALDFPVESRALTEAEVAKIFPAPAEAQSPGAYMTEEELSETHLTEEQLSQARRAGTQIAETQTSGAQTAETQISGAQNTETQSAMGTFHGETGELIRLEGKIGDAKVIYAQDEFPVSDVKIEGNESISTVCGVSVTTGYFVTNQNSKGEQSIIFYADFKTGSINVYVELAGDRNEAETVSGKIAGLIYRIIEKGETDLKGITK